MVKKQTIGRIGCVVLLLLAIVCLLNVLKNNNQAMMPVPLELEILGEYSFDNKEWFPLTEDSDLSTRNGNLYVRGHFNNDIMDGAMINLYCNHIGIEVFVNDERIFMNSAAECLNYGMDITPSMCGKYWFAFLSPKLTKEDEITISFKNIHKYGNENAFRDALYTIYVTPNVNEILEIHMKPHVQPVNTVGACVLIIAMMLLGASLLAVMLKSQVRSSLFYMGITTLFVGGYIIFDVMMIYLMDELLVVKTYGRQLCMMLAAFFGCVMLCKQLKGQYKKIGNVTMGISFVVDVVLISLSILGKILIYDTQPIWMLFQFAICLVLGICLVLEISNYKKESRIELYGFLFLMFAMILDLLGYGTIQYHSGLITKIVFIMLLVAYFLRGGIKMLREYHASVHNKKLQEELENSRIAIMLSQIQPHFLYNVIGTIRGLCRSDAEQAWRALGDFANYLRGNMDALSNRDRIHFSMELKHIEAYLRLEQMRMGDELHIVYDIVEKDFYLPPLTIQPLVENAVKHGLFDKEGGGTVRLSSKKVDDGICIEVEDDGVGFDALIPIEPDEHHAHIGLINVQKRIEKMSKGEMIMESKPGTGTKVTVILRYTERGTTNEYIGD